MSEKGWCVKEHGKLHVRTLMPFKRGAMVNFLVHNRGCTILEWHTEKEIEAMWEEHKEKAVLVRVNVDEIIQ